LRDEIPQEPKTNFYLITNQDAFHTDADLPVAVEPIRFFTWQVRDRLKFILPEDFKPEEIKLPAKIILMQDGDELIQNVKNLYLRTQLKKVEVGGNANNPDPDAMVFAPAEEEGFLKPPIKVDAYFSLLDIK